MDFEWDRKKAVENVRKHDGITFDEATLVFFDDWAIDELDDAHSDDMEERYIIVGLARTRLMRVVYTVRAKVRIISAEAARPFEREAYNNNRNEYDR